MIKHCVSSFAKGYPCVIGIVVGDEDPIIRHGAGQATTLVTKFSIPHKVDSLLILQLVVDNARY